MNRPVWDWSRVLWGKPDSPPSVICSYCCGGLPEVPMMLCKNDGHVARFCDACVDLAIGLGVLILPRPPYRKP